MPRTFLSFILLTATAPAAWAQAPAADKPATPVKALPPAATTAKPGAPAVESTAPNPADHGFVRFRGAHPVPAAQGGGFCHISRLHFHGYDAEGLDLHVVKRRDTRLFVGDPVAFGYEGTKFGYYFHHPLPGGVGLCFIDGPHWHATPPLGGYKKVEDVNFYVGKLPQNYHEVRKEAAARTKFYKDARYERPKAPAPPKEWTDLWTGILAGKPLPASAVGPVPGSPLDRAHGLPLDQAALREKLKLRSLAGKAGPLGAKPSPKPAPKAP